MPVATTYLLAVQPHTRREEISPRSQHHSPLDSREFENEEWDDTDCANKLQCRFLELHLGRDRRELGDKIGRLVMLSETLSGCDMSAT